MNRAVSFVLLAVGIILLIYGINATESLSSEFSEFFTGSPTNQAIWLLLGGIVCTILGLFGAFRTNR